MTKKPTITHQEVIAKTRLFTVEELHLTFSNGAQRIYERLITGGRGAVLVVPVINDEEFILIKEYAAGVDNYELGFPKGLIEEHESPEQAANRELQEEAGLKADKIVPLKQVSLAPGYLSHQMHIVLAQQLTESQLEGDEPEPIEVVRWRFDQIDQLIQDNNFSEARSIAALYLAKELLAKEA